MGEMWDAVTWGNLAGKPGAKAGYRDGAKSQWPAEAWTKLAPGPFLNITVLADERWECFDSEAGNATPEKVATACANRLQSGLWSVIYTNFEGIGTQTRALSLKGVGWAGAETWPKPGIYLWAADPSGNITKGAWEPPVTPVAVQDQWLGTVDHSTTHGTFPALPAVDGPPVPPTPSKLAAPAVGMACTSTGKGYIMAGADGGVFTFGDASFHGSLAGTKLAAPIVGICLSPTGKGYWLVAGDGGVFTFGDAAFEGSEGA
jgi:hypothetical protein